MASEEAAFRALTLLVAVAEQALLELEALDPPDARLSGAIEQMRDHVYTTLGDDERFKGSAKL